MAKVLIVDDSMVMRNNIEYIFLEAGHEIVGKASDGKQATVLYKELQPDIVTMDISMPIMNGVDAVTQIIEIDPEARIIMISALNQKQMLFEAINRGAKHYVLKPVETKSLLKIVNQVLSEKGRTSPKPNTVKTSTSNDKQPAFHVENNNGTFIIHFSRVMKERDITSLDLVMQGLMQVKPLRMVIDIGNIEHLGNQVLKYIEQLSERVKQVGGDWGGNLHNNEQE
ncbi:MAG: hypothetical protein CVU84_01470 [Firmicutes bacterium HGW-Firmicutes-1]|jgi:YesN/AraC family two-component response regulator|nr:MAG: hypothetical protein CVU84_01470 [Firmicutes bacterium HGW-Firmicutes-1]